ncbi:MAG: hypothetical protein WBF87_12820 [Mesorhizobium sp.]
MITRAAEVDRQFQIVATTVGTALKSAIIDAATALQDFIDRFNGFEARRDASLDEDLASLGRERLDIETKIAEIRSRGDGTAGDGILGTSFGDSGALGAIADHERRMEAIASEEAMILDVLESRRKLREAPAPTSAPVIPSPVTTTPATPSPARSASRSNSTSEIERERQAVTSLIAELERELSLIGASDVEREISNRLRQAGASATADQQARITTLITAIRAEEAAQRSASEAKQEFAQLAEGAISGFAQDLMNGASAGEAFKNMINRLAAQLVDLAVQMMIIRPLMSMFGFSGGGFVDGAGGGFKGMIGYDSGGYTGHGGKYEPAGIVHKGEYVVSKAAVGKIGVANLEAMHQRALSGFADGGYVGDAIAKASNLGNTVSAGGYSAQTISISAPITVNGSAGTPEQNADLAKQMSKQIEATMRGVVADEMRRQTRPGNFANRRGR